MGCTGWTGPAVSAVAVSPNSWGRKIMKIHIIGGPGSGKTFLADKLSRQYGIPHYDLDDLQWDNAANDYGTKRDPQERAALLDQILQNDGNHQPPEFLIECFVIRSFLHFFSVPPYFSAMRYAAISLHSE